MIICNIKFSMLCDAMNVVKQIWKEYGIQNVEYLSNMRCLDKENNAWLPQNVITTYFYMRDLIMI